MLLFFSDIHLTDGTAFKSHLNADAFREVFYGKLSALLRRRPDVKELTIVILGDFFDLIRTREWFDILPI